MKKIYFMCVLMVYYTVSLSQVTIFPDTKNEDPYVSKTVYFYNYSPSGSYLWTFNPNTVTYLEGTHPGSKNPKVKFNAVDNYEVTLQVTGNSTYTGIVNVNVVDYPTFEISLSENDDPGYVAISIKPSIDIISNAEAPVNIDHLQFGIMWDKEAVNGNKLDFDMVCESEEIAKYYKIRQKGYPDDVHPLPWNTHSDDPDNQANWDYRNFEKILGETVSIPIAGWSSTEWHTIALLKVYARTLGGHLEPEGNFYIIPLGDPDNIVPHCFDNLDGTYDQPCTWFMKSSNPKIELEHSPIFDLQIKNGPIYPVLLPIPTIVSGYVWVGGATPKNGYDQYSWNYNKNWRVGCGNERIPPENPPSLYDDCMIPELLDEDPCYPRNDIAVTPGSDPNYGPAEGNNVTIQGGRIEWMKDITLPNGTPPVSLWVYGDLKNGYENFPDDDDTISNSIIVYKNGHLKIGGDLNILEDNIDDVDLETYYADFIVRESGGIIVDPGGYVNAFYDTYLEADTALVIRSDANGTGSFINSERRGGMHYNNDVNDPVKVETYVTGIEGTPENPVYYMHFVGPTVHDSTPGWENRVRLQQFDMTHLDTFAWEWDPTIDWTDPNAWVNVYPYWWPEPIGTGLILTNGVAGTGTIEMEGTLITENFSYDYEYSADNQLLLVSNPYSAPMDFNEFYEDNQDFIFPKFRIYDNSGQNAGNYFVYTQNTSPADSAFIQVGQGFFVHTRQGGTLVFDNSVRKHKRSPFREVIQNCLHIKVSGGTVGFKDELYIRFDPDATLEHDLEIESKKWNSPTDGATMIRSIADDGTELYANVLPQNLLLPPNTYEVPVQFECGENEIYTLSFDDMESFEYGTEIWIEDKIAETGLIQITPENSQYSFYGSPDENKDRFAIHFTAIYNPDFVDESQYKLINIYTSDSELYLLNNSKETIEEIAVFNMLGQEIYRSKLPEQNTYKFNLHAPTGYYVARVRTNKNIYSEKVFIKAY